MKIFEALRHIDEAIAAISPITDHALGIKGIPDAVMITLFTAECELLDAKKNLLESCQEALAMEKREMEFQLDLFTDTL
jgi:hypothetical protein